MRCEAAPQLASWRPSQFGQKPPFEPTNIEGISPDVAHNKCMAFEYLTVLISVVIGLSVTSFLTNVARIIHVRADVTISWVQLLWSVTILIWTIAFWWFTFVLAEQQQWTYPLFVFFAGLFDSSFPSDGASVSGGRASGS